MNLKLSLFVVFVFMFVTILAIVQMAVHLSFGIITLPQFAPAMAYILVAMLFKELYRPITIKINKIILIKAFIAIIFPLVLFTSAYYVGKLIGMDIKTGSNLFSVITTGILGIIAGAVTEEIGWRSFFQPTLEQKHSVFVSCLIVGLTWGIWHIGHFINGPLFMFGFVVFTVSVSVIIVFLYKNTQNNIIISSLFHASINIGFTIYFTNGFENIRFFLIISFVWLLAAVIVLLCGNKYFFRNHIKITL
jgi:membrane protease YdiL (CAAX protease family)